MIFVGVTKKYRLSRLPLCTRVGRAQHHPLGIDAAEGVMRSRSDIQSSRTNVFWGDMAQVYEHDGVRRDTLVGFIGDGIKAGGSAIVIATARNI